MAVPTSGQLNMLGLANEKNVNDFSDGDTEAAVDISLKGLSNDSFQDFGGQAASNIALNTLSASNPPNQTEPYQMSEFYDYDHDFSYPVWALTYGNNDQAFQTQSFDIQVEGRNTTPTCGTTIGLTWGQSGTNGSLTWYEADAGTGDIQINGNDSYTGGTNYNLGWTMTNFTSSAITKMEARWRIVSSRIFSQGGSIHACYHPSGQFPAQLNNTNDDTTQTMVSGSTSLNTNFSYTGSWVEITPAVVGGSSSNTQMFSIHIDGAGSGEGDVTEILYSSSSSAWYLDIRFSHYNSSGTAVTTTKSFKKTGTGSSQMMLRAENFETPEFTCIMPDMMVYRQGTYKYDSGNIMGWTNEGEITFDGITSYDSLSTEQKAQADALRDMRTSMTRIGDIVVGDRIAAQGNLNDNTVADQWVEVTEARTHTRGGYWNVEGIHITNDHPVWLDHNGTKDWVKVEDMWDGITRSYVAGTVDPVYLGTSPGWYSVYSPDMSQIFTVSGDYAPTTE